MFPWMWFCAPALHFPFSGSVAQQIEPNASWFFPRQLQSLLRRYAAHA